MSASQGLLDFFVLEASECVEQLDGLLSAGGASGPDPTAFVRQARALRGSATMARIPDIAEVAGGLERLGRSLIDQSLVWNYAVGGAAVAAVDDLKILVRAVRGWSDADERRAQARVAELATHIPTNARSLSAPTPGAGSGSAFVAAQTLQISVALDAVAQRPTGRDALGLAMRRLRALHGVASIRDLPPLPEILDAIERTLQPIELGTATPTAQQLALLSAAVPALRRASQEIAATGRMASDAPEVRNFMAAVQTFDGDAPESDHIVPIASLFFPDAGPHIVSATQPPMTVARRFRLEVASLAEHVRRVVADARRAADPMSRDRAAREVRSALRAIQLAAASFDQTRIADFFSAAGVEAGALEAAALSSVDGVAAILADPAASEDTLAARVNTLIPSGSAAQVAPDEAQPATPGLDSAIGIGLSSRADSRTPLGIATTEPRLGEQMGFGGGRPRAPSGPVAPIAEPSRAAPPPVRTPTPLSVPRVSLPAVPAVPTPSAASQPAPSGLPFATGEALQGALQQSIDSFADLEGHLLADPAPVDDEMVVPIEQLLYRGRSAVERAQELCDDARKQGRALDSPGLEEMADLLVLALAE